MKQSDAKQTNQEQMQQNAKEYELESDDQGESLELDEEQVIGAILAMGNEIWRNLGQTQTLNDVSLFFDSEFYIKVF